MQKIFLISCFLIPIFSIVYGQNGPVESDPDLLMIQVCPEVDIEATINPWSSEDITYSSASWQYLDSSNDNTFIATTMVYWDPLSSCFCSIHRRQQSSKAIEATILVKIGEDEYFANQEFDSALIVDDDPWIFISPYNDRYFQYYGSRKTWWALGENMCWPSKGSPSLAKEEYSDWIRSLAGYGGNYIRLWLAPTWNLLALEKKSTPLGRFDSKAVDVLDHILAVADKYNVKIMMTIDSFNSFRATDPYPDFQNSPYNSANGGPLTSPEQFFTNEQAKSVTKDKIRYLISRYNSYRSVLSWEFWNEVDLTTNFNDKVVAKWHEEMSTYLKSLPTEFSKPISTSFCKSAGFQVIDSVEELDYVQTHSYNAKDMSENAYYWSMTKAESYPKKPHFIGEFGIGDPVKAWDNDPLGIHLHNGMWSQITAMAAGSSMTWWWDSYIDPHPELYQHWAQLSAFTSENFPLASISKANLIVPPSELVEADERLSVTALGINDFTVVYIKNVDFTYTKVPPLPSPTAVNKLNLRPYSTGTTYRVELWETYQSLSPKIIELTASHSSLTIPIPSIIADLAIKIYPSK